MKLTAKTYINGLNELITRDLQLANIVSRWGEPPFWTHEPGFPGILLAILSQQVSIESAQAVYTKVADELGSITAEGFLTLEDHLLRSQGFSRQKAAYSRDIAAGVTAGWLNFEAIARMDDETARRKLIELRGIGPWTADTYLLFSLQRQDVWPSGDLALLKTIQKLLGLEELPRWDHADSYAERWRPWRAVAARLLWHDYLCERGRS